MKQHRLAAIAREAKQFDHILNIDRMTADAIKNKFLDAPLTKQQLADFIQIPPEPCSSSVASGRC